MSIMNKAANALSGGGGSTRGGLTAAEIYEVLKGKGSGVKCMFNPYEYSITRANEYKENSQNGGTKEFSRSQPIELTLPSLIFDTYESGSDLLSYIKPLWDMMNPVKDPDSSKGDKLVPPQVCFAWGTFSFQAVIINLTQKFTLFTKDGKPVRAKVDIKFLQTVASDKYPMQNPTSGGGPIQSIWSVVRGDRLDLIAAKVYGDATKWRTIAEFNNITNPFVLKPGQKLTIPEF